jgi:hypothetical protein
MRNSARVDAYRNGGNDDGRPQMGTRLTNKEDGSHAVGSSGLVTVVDEVLYKNLTPGEEYTVTGSLHHRVDNEDGIFDTGLLVDGGVPVTATTTFVPDSPDGSVKLEFSFHAELLDGGAAVAFEDMRSLSDESFVLEHKDIKDGWQTVNEKGDVELPDDEGDLEGHDEDEVIQTPRRKDDVYIGTRLATIDSQKIVTTDGSEAVVLTDLVDYHNLVPGRRYRMSGTLHVRAYDDVLKKPVDGGAIKGSGSYTDFTPEQPDGTVEVKLVMPASEILFQPVVAYEELTERETKSGVASDTIIADHKDITNEDQTVLVTMPAADEVAMAPLLQTGDRIVYMTIAGLALTAILGGSIYYIRRKKV